MGKRRTQLGILRATTSVAALIVAGAAATPASAACVNVTGTFSNPAATTIDGICIANRTFNGNVTNAGTITPLGVVIVNSRITTAGAATFIDSGPTLAGGINIDSTSQLSSNNNTVSITGAVFTGGILNAGTITSTSASGRAIIVTGTSTFTGGITNTGTLTATAGNNVPPQSVGVGIRVVGTSTFEGGIANSGSIAARSRGIVVEGGSTFSGGITNSGTISTSIGNGIRVDSVTSFLGGVTNSGTITSSATNTSGIFVGSTVSGGLSTFSGDILNSGTIGMPGAANNGMRISNVGTISGTVTNGGTITSSDTGVYVENVTSLTGVTNSGTISSANANGIRLTNFGTLTNGIANNSGTITSFGNSIYAVNGVSLAGGITNSGTLSSSNADGIRLNNVTFVTGNIANSGSITAASAAVSFGTASTFTGNITNSGSIASSSGVAIAVNGVSTFTGNIVNSGTLSGSVAGGVTNGTIHVQNVSTFAGGIANSGVINAPSVGGILVEGVGTFTGGIVNSPAGTITAHTSGILVQNSGSFGGGIVNNGLVSSSNSGGISVSGVSLFTGGVTNAGTITSQQTGIFVDQTSTFSGGILNAGTITSTNNSGISVTNVETFSNGISNGGIINSRQTGIFVSGVSAFSGGIINSGTVTSTNNVGISISAAYIGGGPITSFSGGITNLGIVSAQQTGIYVNGVSTFAGGISNSGTITSTTGMGIAVGDVSNFSGGVTNTGSISAADPIFGIGIQISGVTQFSGGVTNGGTINAANAGIAIGSLCGCGPIGTFTGGVINSGSIVAAFGIQIGGVDTFTGGVTNSGTINADGFGISLTGITSFDGGIVNSGAIVAPTIGINGISVVEIATFTGGILNSGTISVAGVGIAIGSNCGCSFGSTFSGGVTNTGTITASIGVFVGGGETFLGGITNGGTIAAPVGGFGLSTGIKVTDIGSFGGGVVNTGKITSTGSSGNGIVIANVSQFTGGVFNSGTISVGGFGIAIGSSCQCGFGSTFSGGVTNTGTIAAAVGILVSGGETFLGGVTNGGTITMATGGFGFPTGIAVVGVGSFGGGIVNGGKILSAEASSNGISITSVSLFTGGVQNSGTISVAGVGIALGSNCGCSFGSTFSGGVTNTGTIVAKTGIFIGTGGTYSGAVANSGNITGTGGTAIDVSSAPNAVTIDQSAGTIIGAIKLSSFADVLNISGGAIAGDITGQNSGSAVNFILGAGMFTYGNTISGVNAVNVNSGLVLLNGTIGPTALTIASLGALVVGNGGSIAGDITDNGVFGVFRTDTYTYAGVISGIGGLQQLGTGTTVLTGANTYLGATLVDAGTLKAGAAGTFAPSSAFTVNPGALLDLNSFNQTIGSLAGFGNVALGSAALTTGGNNTSTTFGGVIGGAGSLVKTGAGVFTLAGANTYTGGTTISGGTLQLGAGGAGGSILGNVLNNAAIAFNRSDTYSFDGVISGSGALNQIGTGTTVLTAANTYTGPTTVDAGKLAVNGSIVSATTVNANGTLGGTGTLGPVTINGGTLAPGNSIGTITINGNLNFVGPGNYTVEVSPANADRTNVTGTATLSGTVHALFGPGTYLPGTTYTIMSANGGRIGTFGALDSVNPPAFAPQIKYTATDVLLTFTFNIGGVIGLNQNQNAVAQSIQTAYNTLGALPTPFYTLASQFAPTFQGALTQVTGEIGTGAANAGFKSMDQFLNTMLDPFLETQLGNGNVQGRALGFAPERQASLPAELLGYAGVPTKAPPPATFEQRWTVWGATYGGTARFNGDAAVGSNRLGVSSGSFAAGIDYRLTPDTVIGVAAAGSTQSYAVDGSQASGRSDAVQGGVYGSTRFGNSYLSGAFAYGRHDVTTERTVAFGGLTDRLAGGFGANSYGGRLEGGYRYSLSEMLGFTPFAAVQVQGFQTPSYTERDLTALNAFALTYNGQSWTDTRSELGARFDYRFPTQNGTEFTIRARAAWAHDFTTDRSINAAFVALPGFGFTVAGARPQADTALVSAGAEWKWLNGLSLRAKFDGEFGNGTQVYTGMGAVRLTW